MGGYWPEFNEGAAAVSGKSIAAGAYLSRLDSSVNAIIDGVPTKLRN